MKKVAGRARTISGSLDSGAGVCGEWVDAQEMQAKMQRRIDKALAVQSVTLLAVAVRQAIRENFGQDRDGAGEP